MVCLLQPTGANKSEAEWNIRHKHDGGVPLGLRWIDPIWDACKSEKEGGEKHGLVSNLMLYAQSTSTVII